MKQTEQNSFYEALDKMTTVELLRGINTEDRKVPDVVAGCIPQISRFVDAVVERMKVQVLPVYRCIIRTTGISTRIISLRSLSADTIIIMLSTLTPQTPLMSL